MKKSALASRVSAEAPLSKVAADGPVGAIFPVVAGALAGGHTFTVAEPDSLTRSRDGRQRRNPATGERIGIAVSTAPSVKVGGSLHNAVNRSGR